MIRTVGVGTARLDRGWDCCSLCGLIILLRSMGGALELRFDKLLEFLRLQVGHCLEFVHLRAG